MKSPELQSVLDEVMRDDSFAEHNAACRARAMRGFRRRQRIKKLKQVTLLAASIMVAAYVSISFFKDNPTQEATVLPVMAGRPNEAVESEPTNLLTDEELLAVFPPGSCYFAEVNGQKVLLFHDEKVREKFFN